MASTGEAAGIWARRVAADGRQGAAIEVARAWAGRDAGFPRMASLHDDIVLVWTESGTPSRIRGGVLPLPALPALAAPASDRAGASLGAVERARAGDPMPEYGAATLEGQAASLAALRGQFVLLNLWATWCEPCRQELPVLAELHRRLASPQFTVVGVSLDQQRSPAEVRQFVERRKIPYPIWLDREDRASAVLDAGVLPVTLLVDRAGIIRWRRDGALSAGDPTLDRAISAALAADPVARGRQTPE